MDASAREERKALLRHNFPPEILERAQWCACGADKIPISPRTGQRASPVDPTLWGTFDEAWSLGLDYVGFVLHDDDPWAVIDNDDKAADPAPPEVKARHAAMVKSLNSYAETSISGRGSHIWLIGEVPRGINCHREHTEIYSRARFVVCTGDVIHQGPIAERQQMLDNMYLQMRGVDPRTEVPDEPEKESDEILEDRILSGREAERFQILTSEDNEWERHFESQSEADLSLVGLFARFSKNNEQVKRMFRATSLGRRAKAWREDYLDRTIRFARADDFSVPPIDFDVQQILGLRQQTGAKLDLSTDSTTRFPPGLVGEIADYVLSTSIRPVREVALTAALGLVAGLAGRTYYTATLAGVNLYLILLARTGTGKESARQGIERLISKVDDVAPGADEFIGPGYFASGQAIIRSLQRKPACLAILGEVGILMQNWCDPEANSAERMILRVLLDCFSKSGLGDSIRPHVYADETKNTIGIDSPSLSFVGESVPSVFYEALDSAQILSGLVPRLLIVEYEGERPKRQTIIDPYPQPALVNRVAELVRIAQMASLNRSHYVVPQTDEVREYLEAFDDRCDEMMRAKDEVHRELWNRAHLNALRVATVVAVGCNASEPYVELEHAKWACEFVERCIGKVLVRFESGLNARAQQISLVETQVKSFYAMSEDERVDAGVSRRAAERGAMPNRYFVSRLSGRSVFANDRRGSQAAIEDVLQNLVKLDRLALYPQGEARKFGARSAKYYSITADW